MLVSSLRHAEGPPTNVTVMSDATTLFSTVLVVGAGTMGKGLARLLLKHGLTVVLSDVDEDVLTAVAGDLDSPRLRTTTNWAASVGDVDLAIETASEQPAVKEAVMRALGEALPPHVVIASNTSSFPVSQLASYVASPERMLCLHFFNPPDVVRLVEVQGHNGTDPAIVARCIAWLTALGSHPVQIHKERTGFVANRLQAALLTEAVALVSEGVVSAAELDDIVTTSIGPRWAAVGPLSVADLGGLHVFASLMGRMADSMASHGDVAAIVQRLADEGKLGARTGEGFHTYDDAGAAKRAKVLDTVTRLAAD